VSLVVIKLNPCIRYSSFSLTYLGRETQSVLWTWVALAWKTVVQKYHASPNLLHLVHEFRRMVNVCIAVGIEENVSSFKTLSLKSYHRLNRNMLSYYRLCAISTATGILHNHRKAEKKNPGQTFHALRT